MVHRKRSIWKLAGLSGHDRSETKRALPPVAKASTPILSGPAPFVVKIAASPSLA
jgi:hypothetical protein